MLVATVAGLSLAGAAHAQVQPVQSAATPAPTTNPSYSTPAPTPKPSAATPAPMSSPSIAGSPIQMPSAIPGKAETASSAFDKLAASGATSITKEDANKLDGFDRAFSEADRDRDGKLSKDEFATAWAIYTGRT